MSRHAQGRPNVSRHARAHPEVSRHAQADPNAGCQMVVDGTDADTIKQVLDLEVEALEQRRVLSTGPLHVDVDSLAPVPDGLGWETAYPALQDALDRAAVLNGDANAENDVEAIWIAEGVYVPSKDKHGSDSPDASSTREKACRRIFSTIWLAPSNS